MNSLEFYGALWRQKIFIACMTAILVAIALFLTVRQQKIYQATSLVRVQQLISDPGQSLGVLTASAQLAQTYAKIVGTTTIAQKIAAGSHGSLPVDQIDGHVSGSPVQGLDLLNISARSPDPLTAEKIANAAPKALERFIRQTGTLRDQVIFVQPASRPRAPASPNLKLNLALAILLGLIFNSALALLIDLIADRIGGAEAFEKSMGVPVLASIPPLKFAPPEPPATSGVEETELHSERPRSVGRAFNG